MISAKKRSFVVEYRPTCIRAARVSSAEPPLVIEDVLEIKGQELAEASSLIRQFAGAKKGNGYLIGNCCAYPESRVVRQVMIDAAKGSEKEFVLDILRNDAKVDPDASLAYCLSPSTGEEVNPSDFNKKSVMLCGATTKEVVALQDGMLEAAVYPNRLELGTVGTIGALRDSLGWADSNKMLLHLEIDAKSTNATILGARTVEMSRSIEFGENDIALGLKEEMNLKDEVAAQRLLASSDFDFGPLARKIIRKLLRELQSSIGFFEVQTGQSISLVHGNLRENSLGWLQSSLAELLNLEPFELDLGKWLDARGVTFVSDEIRSSVDLGWLGLLSLVLDFNSERPAA